MWGTLPPTLNMSPRAEGRKEEKRKAEETTKGITTSRAIGPPPLLLPPPSLPSLLSACDGTTGPTLVSQRKDRSDLAALSASKSGANYPFHPWVFSLTKGAYVVQQILSLRLQATGSDKEMHHEHLSDAALLALRYGR